MRTVRPWFVIFMVAMVIATKLMPPHFQFALIFGILFCLYIILMVVKKFVWSRNLDSDDVIIGVPVFFGLAVIFAQYVFKLDVPGYLVWPLFAVVVVLSLGFMRRQDLR